MEVREKLREELHQRVLDNLDLSCDIEDDNLEELIYQVLQEFSKEKYLSIDERVLLGKELFNTFRKLDILQELLEDETVTEIMINGTSNIFVEQEGKLHQLDKRFYSKQKLEDIIQQIVAGSNRIVNESTPIADARLLDGSRVNIVLQPIALNGPIVTIRKFSRESITMEHLIKWKSVPESVAQFLEKLVVARYNIFISGGTGSGKTTFLNALSGYIPSDERIITVEDNAELQLKNIPNLVSLETRNPNVEGDGEISMRALIKSSLRMRPTRIIVGEVRGPEVVDMLGAMNTGHDGSLSTGHGNSVREMLGRLETMVLMGMELPLTAVRSQIAAGVDIMVHVGRLRDGSRKLLEIAEVQGCEDGEVEISTLYKFEEKGGAGEKVMGTMKKVNEIYHKEKLMAAGYQD